MKRIGILCILITTMGSVALGTGITDTVIAIEEVVTTSLRFEDYSIGASVYSIDSTQLKNSGSPTLSGVLSQQSICAVKSYGNGGLATLRIRGGNPEHTLLVWNGFGIRSALHGSINFSTIPVVSLNGISVQHGGSAAMYGNGAATGAIFLFDNITIDNSGTSSTLNSTIGSFQSTNNSIRVKHSGSKFASSISASYAYSQNNFSFRNTKKFGNPLQIQQNDAFEQFSVSQKNAYRLTTNSKIESNVWYTKTYKQAPGLMSDLSPGTAQQTNHNLRTAITYSNYFQKGYVKARSGFFSERNIFFDRDTTKPVQHGDNKALISINELETNYSISRNQQLYLGVNYTKEYGYSVSYKKPIMRNRSSVFGAYRAKFFQEYLNTSVEWRQEFDGIRSVPFIYSFGFEEKIISNLSLKGNISKHYSLPTLNDLFWGDDAFARGNPNLKPETGWSYEAGLSHHYKSDNLYLSNEISLFQTDIENWIIWENNAEIGKYSPVNRDQIDSKGIEYFSKNQISIGKTKLLINLLYAYTDATAFETQGDVIIQYPKVYTPKHKFSVASSIAYKKLVFGYNQMLSSKLYVDGTGTNLNAYTLANASVNYEFNFSRIDIHAGFNINNIYNAVYEITAGYAQPLRNYQINLNFKF